MLFNSHTFIFLFLPLTLAGFGLLGRFVGRRGAMMWLVAASLFYYGWWEARYLLLILSSMGLNYGLGRALGQRPSRPLLTLGVMANLGALGWFIITARRDRKSVVQ